MTPRGPSRSRTLLAAAAAVALLSPLGAGCGADPAAAPVAPPASPPAATGGARGPAPAPAGAPVPPPRFVEIDASCGFAPVNHTGKPDQKDWIAEGMGGSCILLDHDSDGDLDILFVDGDALEGEPWPEARTRLYRNDGGLRFTEVTEEAGIAVRGVGYGGAAVDYDSDGDPDLFLTFLGTNRLLRNDGGRFTDVTAAAGVGGPETDMSTACAWGDFDGDGRLDVYVANYCDMRGYMETFRRTGRPPRSCPWRGLQVYCGPGGLPFQKDRLFLQTKPGVFEDASDRLAKQVPRPAFQPVAADFDGDGDLDIYVSNDTVDNTLWVNDGKGYFRDEGMVAGCAVSGSVTPQASMGTNAADHDGDGRIDLIVTNFSHDHYTLYRNTTVVRTDGTRSAAFEDASVRTGIAQPTYLPLGWGACWQDFDLDGDLDLFFANGHVYGEIDDFQASGTTYRQRNMLLRNRGGREPFYEDVTAAAGPGLEPLDVFRGAVAGDLDDDGDMDLVVAALNGRARILRNDLPAGPGWIRLSLRGTKGARDPAGAEVRVELPGGAATGQVVLRGSSFCGSEDPRLLFGLGGAAAPSLVRVKWPSGAVQEFRGLGGKQHWLLVEGEATPSRVPPAAPPSPPR
jgi:hypothetical protein